MLDLPLHPVVVHFPIVLGILLPFAGLLAWWGIKKEIVPQKTWLVIPALALVFTISSVVAVELGEKDEDKVEKFIAEDVIEEHEEAGEAIPWVAGTLLVLSLGTLMRKNSHHLRLAVAVVSFAALVPLIHAGHTGGELVYQYGAANAHLSQHQLASVKAGTLIGEHAGSEHEDEDDEKDDDDD
jgi:uncharacterized membrane protein